MFGEHLEKRLKQMASDMIEACGKRVGRHFEVWIKKGGLIGGTSSDYLLPSECCVMVNVILDCKTQVNNFLEIKQTGNFDFRFFFSRL